MIPVRITGVLHAIWLNYEERTGGQQNTSQASIQVRGRYSVISKLYKLIHPEMSCIQFSLFKTHLGRVTTLLTEREKSALAK